MNKEKLRQLIIDEFHKLYYNEAAYKGTWFGYEVNKSPLDCWIYQEIIYDVKPDIIIECGSAMGGSALFFANMIELIGNPEGRVYSIDINPTVRLLKKHSKITFLTGYSTDPKNVSYIKTQIKEADKVLVNLDSGHDKANVLNELKTYGNLVTKGSYMIVEDSNIYGHPVLPNWEYGEGPYEAIEEFLKTNNNFKIDKKREHFLFSFNPNGYLLKI